MKTSIKALLVSAAVCGLFATAPAEAGLFKGNYAVTTHNTTQTQLSRADVTQVQRKLAALDFYKGPKDGSWGRGTTAATRDFQISRGFAVTGMPTPETLTALDVMPTRRDSTSTPVAVTEIAPVGGGAVYQENSVRSETYTSRGQNGVLGVDSNNQNGSTCLTCTNGIYGTGNTANMHSNEY